MTIVIKELSINDLTPNLLQHFNRYQEVRRCWRREHDEWVLKEISFIEQWDEILKQEIVREDFRSCIHSGGTVWGVFDGANRMIAFASLLSDFFGSSNQYLQLMQIHVSYEHRGRGIGKKLFELCAEKAKAMGAAKLYISTHSSEESQVFYHKIGCMDAIEVNQKLAEHEPYDRQMEFVLE
ncbi:GNAT family N-acetyltransferase [Paenibacillus lupini]|uniref:GNAT family N-acetyltransferase n=1 Tax=Paenibacillus lupini TaxID=1450204 RepID=UPI00142418F4|nr:GNAT family N-acetyltransferase [Paenibacillus lupini]NIK23497.1 ribosomal protein S18 acetylase RimI-like enzyme [Paenibacillus lupini]